MSVITVENVTKRYGDVRALDGVSLSVDEGQTLGLVGTNGAGKTTLFRVLAGHDRPEEGTVRVTGMSPDAGAKLRQRVGFLPEDAGFQPSLTGREVLRFYARMRDVPADRRTRRVRRILATVGLDDAADRPVGGYSNGMNRRLALGTILLRRPDVLLLDEPTAGLDPRGVADFNAIVDGIRSETDVTVVLSTHDLAEVERLCDRAVVLDGGRIRVRGTVDELRRDAGDGVRVTATVGSPAERAATAVRDRHGTATVETAGDRVTVDCPSGEAMSVLTTLHEVTDVEQFEVSTPGLADAFRDALGRGPNDGTAAVAHGTAGGAEGGESP